LGALALVVVLLTFYREAHSSNIKTGTKNHVASTSLLTTQHDQILIFCFFTVHKALQAELVEAV
jgi:hypothetical protein